MNTAPFVKTSFEPRAAKAVIALFEPDIALAPWLIDVPHILIAEEDVVITIEFPNQESLARFISKVAAL